MISFSKRQDALVGVDSDGCVFDTMRVKQREHFHPLILRFWGLEPVEPVLREVAEFVNLRSAGRGRNRFEALLETFERLREHPAARDSGVELPPTGALRRFLASGVPPGNPALRAALARDPDPELRRLLAWSLAVNHSIDTRMPPCPPFAGAVEALETMAARADILVVSQTPVEALRKEWGRHGLATRVRAIGGQEAGPKRVQLAEAAGGRYPPERVLMVGDAPADLEAARHAGVLFYPIVPGEEPQSWRRLREEAFPRFLDETYAGDYAETLIRHFQQTLPVDPPWHP